MITEYSQTVSGFIYDSSVHSLHRTELLKCKELTFIEEIAGSKWEKFQYVSQQALCGEDLVGHPGPFKYTILCRRSGSRIAILSVSRRVVDNFVDRTAQRADGINLKRIPIAVDELVRAITTKPTSYALSYVHARVPAFGASLKSVSYYGEDLAEASLFKDNINMMNYFNCGLRSITGGGEIVKLGGDGMISFIFSGPSRVLEVEQVLKFLRENSYLSKDFFG